MIGSPDRRRRSIRLRDYDYTSEGMYFITLCAHLRACAFAQVDDARAHLSEIGRIIEEEWYRTAELRPYVLLDAFIIMPNHVHGVIMIIDEDRASALLVGAQRAVPLPPPNPRSFGQMKPRSLPAIVRAFKSATTRRTNELRGTPGIPLWQRNYYEHVIRSRHALDRVRNYIVDNPARWPDDPENPLNLALLP